MFNWSEYNEKLVKREVIFFDLDFVNNIARGQKR